MGVGEDVEKQGKIVKINSNIQSFLGRENGVSRGRNGGWMG